MDLLRPDELLLWLLGEWTFSREAQGYASMHGCAVFLSTGPEVAAYHETVSVQLVDRLETLHAEQRYEYRTARQGLAIYFAPPSPEAGKLFHLLNFSAGGDLRAYACHQCRDDLYLSEYVFPADSRTDSFSVRHSVEGPRKQYTLVSRYTRRP